LTSTKRFAVSVCHFRLIEQRNIIMNALAIKRAKKNLLHLQKIVLQYPVIFMNFKKHYELFKILKFYRDNGLIKSRTYTIYLFSYVSKKFSIKEKLFALTHHYDFLKNSFKNCYLKQIFREGLLCWEEQNENDKFRVVLQSSDLLEFEGSLTLFFTVNNTKVFKLSFNFAPGQILGVQKPTVVFITALKGIRNEFSNISLATKAFSEIVPQVILMKVVESIASSLNLDTVITINATSQISFSEPSVLEKFYKTYDQFWENLGGERLIQGYFCFKCPYIEKSISSIKSKHRKRVLHKRNKLKQIFEKTLSYVSDYKMSLLFTFVVKAELAACLLFYYLSK
jgi:uncharacterized protein VirK/YbjX